MKTKISVDFQICFSVPLMIHENELTLFNRTESSHKWMTLKIRIMADKINAMLTMLIVNGEN